MRDYSLLIAILGAILVRICSSDSQSFDVSTYDEPVRMASESLVVKSYKDAESSTTATIQDRSSFEEFQVYQGVMGRPGVDFPVYPYIPATSFSCRGVKKSGYYADLDTDCQVFHICDGNRKISFLCPNGTIFRQSHLICDWWFRVDCGKSVELYEESAEQLEADQKIYKARAEERERRRKQGKTVVSEKGGELTSSEVYALDEPYQIKNRKPSGNQVRNQFSQFSTTTTTTTTTRAPPLRFDGRKPERHSKKVVFSDVTESFPAYNRDKTNERIPEKVRTFKDRPTGEIRQYSTTSPTNNEPNLKVSFIDNRDQPVSTFVQSTPFPSTPSQTTAIPKAKFFTPNSINLEINKENIRTAESGSLVEDLANRDRNYNFPHSNYKPKEEIRTDLNNRGKTNYFSYSENAQVNQTSDANNKNRNNNFVYNNDNNRGKTNYFSYSENTQVNQTSDTNNGNLNNNFAYNNNNKKLEEFDAGVTDYTTEHFDYESRRTNPVVRQETVTPTAQTRRSHSSRVRTSTVPYVEQERQYLAETASFASNRGSKSYSDYQNQFERYNKGSSTTAPNNFKSSYYQTSRVTERLSTTSTQTPVRQRPNYNSQSTNYQQNQNYNQQSYDYFRTTTTTHRPIKQHSRKVSIFPVTSIQTTIANRLWQTTTAPYVETTTANDRFTTQDVYFTTPAPSREVEFLTENHQTGVSEIEYQTRQENVVSTLKPDVDISLQELTISKTTPRTDTVNKTYEDFVREGLEIPPSSGPNAIRSFALYFATTNNDLEEGKTTSYIPVTGETDFTTTLSPFEIKKKEVVKQVDELVQKSSANVSDHHHVTHSEDSLPNSLTPHTKDSFSALFPETAKRRENATGTTIPEIRIIDGGSTEPNFETTAFESFTEEPTRINTELTKNDLDGSQSRGLVEPDPNSDTDYSKVSPDLRELAQVFTKALSAYLDDPEAFRKVLSEIRPTEPTFDSEANSVNPNEYPSATQEDDEVLDFSDVTKSTYKKKASTYSNFRETTTEYIAEPPSPTRANDIENLVLPLNQTSWATNIELTAPLFESLDQSQSSYYTPPPFIGTTNAIAEEINNEFTVGDNLPRTESNEAVDSYLPIKGSVDDPSLPRYGGFQNNTKPTTKYSPYGAELSTTFLPLGPEITSTGIPDTAATVFDETRATTTFDAQNSTSFFSHFSKNETQEEEIQLAKELNNLVLLQKFTTPRGSQKETTTAPPNLSTLENNINAFESIKLGNGEILEKSTQQRTGKSLHFPETTITSNYFDPNPKEINLELSPPSSTPKGFLITYSLESSSSSEPATYLPKATTPNVPPTTYVPGRERITTLSFAQEIPSATDFDNLFEKITKSRSTSEYVTTATPTVLPTTIFGKSTKSIERLTQLQETLMFNTNNPTLRQRDEARITVEKMMDGLNMTDTTANALMKVMEMAAKNETYRRLVLLLVNDKSGRNKSVEEARLSLLKALLTPVINQKPRSTLPIPETSKLIQSNWEQQTNNLRRSKSISSETSRNIVRTTTTTTSTSTTTTTTTPSPTTTPRRATNNGKNSRRVKTNRGLARAESNYGKSAPGLGNLGVIRRTIENSKNKQVRINSIDDAILDSDSRAVELLKSLYSLAARWG